MKNINFTVDIRSTRLPIVSITEGTFNGLNFLVDTGCTSSILFANAAKKYANVLQTEGENNTMYGIDATPHNTIVVFGDMIFGGKLITAEFNLINDNTSLDGYEKELGFSLHGILGIDFMLANGWVIDIIHQCIIVTSDEQSLAT